MENSTGNTHVELGKQLTESTYQRRSKKWKELDLGHIKIDHYDPNTRTIHETKKSPKLEKAHIAQVKYYMYEMEKMGISGLRAVIEYPKQRQTKMVNLSDDDKLEIASALKDIQAIVNREECPPLIQKSYCKSCAYYDFCYS